MEPEQIASELEELVETIRASQSASQKWREKYESLLTKINEEVKRRLDAELEFGISDAATTHRLQQLCLSQQKEIIRLKRQLGQS